MRKKIRIYSLYLLLLLLALFFVFAIYMSSQTQQEYEETVAEASEGYDYEEIQAMVKLPDPENTNLAEEEFEPPYDLEEMLRINEDFKGWLWIPDTDVNYPVVQGEDNNEHLRRGFQGGYCHYGTLFLDYKSLLDSQNRVIHGHNMGSNRLEMVSTLVKYQDPEWAAERTIAYFTEPDDMQDNTYELFAVLNFNINNLDTFNYFQTDFETDEEYAAFVDYLKERSLYESEFYPERDLLILSTCNRYYGYDNRLLVCFGRIDPEE